jgi:hypothetical protein
MSPQEEIVRSGDRVGQVLDLRFTFLEMSRSTTAACILHIALEIRRAETINSGSQLEAQLQGAPVEQFPKSHHLG